MAALKKLWWVLMLLGVCLAYGVTPASAQDNQPTRDPVFEQDVYERLAAINPEAVLVFMTATQSYDAGNYAAAKQGYEQVLQLAPGFPDAERRLSYCWLQLGDAQQALLHAQNAFKAEPSTLNKTAVAVALLDTKDQADASQALALLTEAVGEDADDLIANQALMHAAYLTSNESALRLSTTNLLRIDPQNPLAHYSSGILAAADGDTKTAERELLLSKELGMPAEVVDSAIEELGVLGKSRPVNWALVGGYTLAGWLGGLVLLFLAGIVLSRITLASAYQPYSTSAFELRWSEKLVRYLYRLVIALSSLYFYASIPLLIILIVLLVVGILYAFLAIGRIPIKLALMIFLAGLFTLYAVVRSLFTRIKDTAPGRLLSRQEATQLWALLEEIARRVGTRPVDAIYITAGTEIAVLERGGMWKKLRGAGERCLVLGLGALPSMTQGQLQAILAHEYGHFSNKDTAGGNLARQVGASLYNMAYGLAMSGQARWYNPAWLFVNGFQRVFARITLGASRLQEILADRYAVLAYGVRDFIDGLEHIVRQSIRFSMQASNAIEASLTQSAPLQNLYTLPDLDGSELLQEYEKKVEQAINAPTSAYDSHPSLQDRFRLAKQITQAGGGMGSTLPVWELLPGMEALQQEMTAKVEENVRKQVIVLPKEPAEGSDAGITS